MLFEKNRNIGILVIFFTYFCVYVKYILLFYIYILFNISNIQY